MGVMGAFVFAAQMINFTIPGTGSSGHLCGGMLLSGMLGPEAGFLTMIGILLVQCLVFADGGLLALGCNIWNMAFYGCFLGGLVIWRFFLRNGVTRRRIVAASLLGSILSLQLGALSVVLETLLSGVTELPFRLFAAAMLSIHLAIGLVEGLITAAVLLFVYEARPELLWTGGAPASGEPGRMSRNGAVGVLLAAAAVTAGGLSLLASSLPDGLEWSVQRVTGAPELETASRAAEAAARVQETLSVLPDYAFANSDSALGTTVSGLAGAAVVLVLCAAVCWVIRSVRRRNAG